MNLDSLRKEIVQHLRAEQLGLFYAAWQQGREPVVQWDVDAHPDFRDFVKAGQAAGCRLLVLQSRAFTSDDIDEALERLPKAELAKPEARDIERRLKAFEMYDGFLCTIELSWELQGTVYCFSAATPWYDEFLGLMNEIDLAMPETGNQDESPFGGFYSRN